MEEINLKLSRLQIEHIFDSLEIYNYIDSAIKDATGVKYSVNDPLALKISNCLGWSEEYRDKRSNEVCEMMDDYNEFNFEDEAIIRQAEEEVEGEIKEKHLNPNHEEKFKMLSFKYDEIRERMGLEPKL